MSSKEINFIENLELIKELVYNKSVSNKENIKTDVQNLFRQLDHDNSRLLSKVIQHLVNSFKGHIPSGNLQLFFEVINLFQAKEDASLSHFSRVLHHHENVRKKLNMLLQSYSSLCKQMKGEDKKMLLEDLTENGNLGMVSAEMGFSAEEYKNLCKLLIDYME